MTENLANNQSNYPVVFGWEQGAKTPFTEDASRKSIYESVDLLQNQPYNNWETFKTATELMYEDTTLGVLDRYSDIKEARRTRDASGKYIDNPLLTKDEANLKYSQYGVTFNRDIRQNEAELIAAKKIKEYSLREKLSQAEGGFLSGASSLMGSFVGSMLDPINIATSFIPVTKMLPALKSLEAAGFWGNVALKGIDGMVMNSLVEPLPLWMATIDQRDYTMADSLFNVVAGGVFGTGIGAFTEGVRALSHGEKFNAGLAAAIDFANNKGIDNITEFQKKNPAITSLAYDDLVELPTDRLTITQGDNLFSVKLNETGPLSSIVGYGKDLESAKRSLRERLGAVLDDDSIFSGYRIDDAIDNFYQSLEKSGNLPGQTWFPKWLDTLQKKAIDKGLSFEEYIAKESDNFTNFEKLLKRATQSRTMQENFAREVAIKQFGELSWEELDEAIEQSAKSIDGYIKLKEAFAVNPKQKMTYEVYIGNLREKSLKGKEKANKIEATKKNLADTREKQEALQKQLDNAEVTTDSENLTKQIDDLNTSILALESELNDFRNIEADDLWKHDADSIELLESMRAKLTEDPRTFDEVKEQLQNQIVDESGKTWDTSDSILDEMLVDETPVADDTRIAKLVEETDLATNDIKQALQVNKITKEEALALGIDNNGQSIEMRRADKRIDDMDKFSQAADDYAACRRTEVV